MRTYQNYEYMISIHSLVKRETPDPFANLGLCEISIHSLVKRETPASVSVTVAVGISIHSLVKRETAGNPDSDISGQDFNPLPRKEGDPLHLFP